MARDDLVAGAGGPPDRWRLWLLTTLGIYPILTVVSMVTGPLLAGLPAPLRFLLITPPLTAAMTWLIMPALSRAFAHFLHGSRPGGPHRGPVQRPDGGRAGPLDGIGLRPGRRCR